MSENKTRETAVVVNADPTQLKILAGLLKKAFAAHGYRADTALSVREANAAFAGKAYDVAVLDYRLPDGTGDALLDAFRTGRPACAEHLSAVWAQAGADRPDCVCLMMTTDPTPELALDWMKRGAAAYLRKPFEPEYLIKLCAKARRERALLRAEDLLEERAEALRKTEDHYRLLFEHANLGIFVARDGCVKFPNPYLSQIVGYSPAELDGQPFSLFIHPEDLPLVATRHQERLSGKTGLPQTYDFRVISKNGTILWVQLCTVLIQWQGRPATLNFLHDITDRKRGEEKREKLQIQLIEAQRMESLGRLAGGVAHDFNNMLGVILGSAELLLTQMDSDHPFHARVSEIQKAALRSADLTRQLLAFARRETIAPKVLHLNKTVLGMLKMLRRLIGEDIEVVWIPGKKVWPVRIDSSQADQILANLCVNARDAIEGVGKVTIETDNTVFDEAYCTHHRGIRPGEYVMLAVSDNGCGMDAETLSKVFEPFFTTKELGKGTGLGLASVYGAVKQNNGFINVYSEPGQGTTFKIYLPRHLAKAGRPAEKSPDKPAKRHHETILLVEDEPEILEVTTIMLERNGYTVVSAGTPGEAIRLANEHAGTIHLLMTDVVMPEMNGRDLAKNILSLYPRAKCLFMSGYTANMIAHHGVLDEGVNFIQKPFSMKGLAVKVQEALDRD